MATIKELPLNNGIDDGEAHAYSGSDPTARQHRSGRCGQGLCPMSWVIGESSARGARAAILVYIYIYMYVNLFVGLISTDAHKHIVAAR